MMGSLRSWIIGALFSVVMASGSVVYNNVTDRLIKLEAYQAESVRERAEMQVDIAVIKLNVAEIRAVTSRIEKKQDQTDDKLNALILTINKNSRDWYNALKEYERILNASRR
jgi:hypothetical protein